MASVSGNIATLKVVPQRNKKILATVKIFISLDPSGSGTNELAYDLSDISCSVTTTQSALAITGIDTWVASSGNTSVRRSEERVSSSHSASIKEFPNCYLTSQSSNGRISYISKYNNTSSAPNIINLVPLHDIIETRCEGAGATSSDGYVTTGLLRRKVRPILTLLDGSIVYEVTEWIV